MPEEVFETPQPTQPVVESKPTNWPRVILAAVLGLGLLATAAYAGYYYGTQQVQPAEKPTPVSRPAPTATPKTTPTPIPVVEDETSGWKTYMYQSKTGGSYEVRYPTDWSFVEAEGAYVRFQKGQYSEELPLTETYISIHRKDNGNKRSLDQWLIENKIIPSTGDPAIESEDVVVGGVKGKQFISTRDGGKIIYLPYGSYVFQLTSVLMGENMGETKTVFDLMLSTFKFLD